ncbi:MAG: hypothetical protein J0M17_16400, partial [Planctomycetes bacterium]|nr:hypothetical protein [Planctomycetota bacterium]
SSLVAGLLMLAYFAHRAAGDDGAVEALGLSLVRALAVFEPARFTILGFATAERYLTHALGPPLLRACRSLLETLLETVRERRRRRALTNSPPPVVVPAPRVPTKIERMQLEARAARAEFEAEEALLKALPLDDDEREVLLLQAKQQLVAKLARLREI